MNSHLDIRIDGKSLTLPDDFSISVEECNPMFNDVEFFSYPVSLPVEQNLAVLRNVGHRDSATRGVDMEHVKAEITADGLSLNTGQVITQEDSEISQSFELNIDAQQKSFSQLIGDLNCQDVDISGDHIVIGEKIGRITAKGGIDAESRYILYQHRKLEKTITLQKLSTTFEQAVVESPQALGFSFPGRCQGFPEAQRDVEGKPIVTESFINVSRQYPHAKYCNARVAYTHPDVNSAGETEGHVTGNRSNSADNRDFGQYWCLDADRPQSGICFYVLYFLDKLFEQLGVAFDKSELMEIEDMARLCFFTTQCHYDEDNTTTRMLQGDDINKWLESRGCGGKIDFEVYTGKVNFGHKPYCDEHSELQETYPINRLFDEKYFHLTQWGPLDHSCYRKLYSTITYSAEVCDMVANSENFPNVAVSSLVSSMENAFGIRFLYDPEKGIVKARLLRGIYSEPSVVKFSGRVLGMVPVNEKITGVRAAYSAESDSKEQRNNVRYGIRDYDTDYDYIEYPEDRTVSDKIYQQLVTETGLISTTNRNVYVDQQTGNTYRIKIDADADEISLLRPTLFQVAQYKGVEYGDCSAQNEDYVRELTIDFQPLTNNIINAQEYNEDTTGNVSPIFAPFLDVDMEHEFLEKQLQMVVHDFGKIEVIGGDSTAYGTAFYDHLQLVVKQTLSLAENYDPTQTDSGNSPLQDIDWGLTLSVMRGGGSDSEIINYDPNYDGFGNYRWRDTIATYEMHSDTMDPKGAVFDYNGKDAGDGGGERFSLQIRSWVQPDWASEPLCADDERDASGKVVNKIRSRGLFDSFILPHAYFLLHRKKYRIRALVEIAQLLDIRNHWTDKFDIDGKIGYIDRVAYDISRADGISEVDIDFYSI